MRESGRNIQRTPVSSTAEASANNATSEPPLPFLLKETPPALAAVSAIPDARHPLVRLRVFKPLKRRNVFPVAVVSRVVCWLILDPLHLM
jgi:hypothetical protein